MRENLTQIKALATATGLFQTVKSTAAQDIEDFPALLITEQEDPDKQTMNTMHTRYQTGWKYTVNLLHAFDHDAPGDVDDWNQDKLEELADAMKAAFSGTPAQPGDYLLISEYRGEAMVSGKECLACELIIQKDGRETYE